MVLETPIGRGKGLKMSDASVADVEHYRKVIAKKNEASEVHKVYRSVTTFFFPRIPSLRGKNLHRTENVLQPTQQWQTRHMGQGFVGE